MMPFCHTEEQAAYYTRSGRPNCYPETFDDGSGVELGPAHEMSGREH